MFQDRLQSALGEGYSIERELTGAGMSRVFVATERALGRKVVLKVLPPELSGGVNIERFRREIQMAAQLQHPHIVPLLTASSDKELLWFTMPFIEGSSLRTVMERAERLPPRDVVRILHDVVDALAYAHARGIVHRDIKPDNILTQGMHALVTDFGVAKALSAAIPAGVGTTTGVAIGTPAYMAPEQLAADPAADHRVDIYAVGLLAYELLTGRSPFNSKSPQQTLAAQLTVMPDAPHRVISDIPEALSAIIMRCLEKDAASRYQSAAELLADLDALPPITSSTTALPRARKRQRTTQYVAIALIVAAAAITVFTLVDRGERSGVATAPAPPAIPESFVPSDTVVLAQLSSDSQPSTSVPVVITRAESLAIAEAIQGRLRAEQSAPSAASPAESAAADAARGTATASASTAAQTAREDTGQRFVFVTGNDPNNLVLERDLLLAEVRKIMGDSLVNATARIDSALALMPRVMRFDMPRSTRTTISPIVPPPAPGTTRIVVVPFSPSGTIPDALRTYGSELANALRTALSSHAELDVPAAELTSSASRGVDHMAASWRLRADYLVTGQYLVRRDSLLVLVHLMDVRTGRFTRASRFAVPTADARSAFAGATRRVVAWIDTARVAQQRRRQTQR